MSVRVYLAGRNPSALDAAATAVTTPGSASFRHFITPAQYAARYAPTSYEKTAVQGNPPPPAASLRATPCSQHYGQLTARTGPDGTTIPDYKGSARPWATCGYLPQQLNAAYGGPANHLTGKGTTIGISLWYASPTQPADENRFDKTHGSPARSGSVRDDHAEQALPPPERVW